MTIEALDAGPLTSVQTAFGRPGWQRLGVRVGGAADPWSARLANRLAGNDDDAPLLEATGSGPTLRFGTATVVALAGAEWRATLDGVPLPVREPRVARAGAVLRAGSGAGLRLYVAVAGVTVAEVLGSAATDLATGFGGHDGRALRRGDRLDVAPTSRAPARQRHLVPPRSGAIRVTAGPHADRFAPDLLTGDVWRVGPEADRTGIRLDGDRAVQEADVGEVPSMGLPLGAIQLPPDGRPIVMLADRPVTGGYPVPACVIAADVGRVAQLRLGEEVRFVAVTTSEAVAALREAEAALATDPIRLDDADDLGWAGALD